ncbi:MAG: DUF4301 family protein [Syntrophales bacterium]
MTDRLFTESDIEQIEAIGLTVEAVLEQIEIFQRGVPPVNLNRPCTINDGIVTIPDKEQDVFLAAYDEAAADGRFLKFVPASGAASRMFKDWYMILGKGGPDLEEADVKFVQDLRKFAFFDDLNRLVSRRGENIDDLIRNGKFDDILKYILTPEGLNYGCLPKALLKFHTYPLKGSRTALEEHLAEVVLYGRDNNRTCRIHFTVSDEHKKAVEEYLLQLKGDYEALYDVIFDLELSVQFPFTNTIAVDMENRPLRNQDGSLVFRPAGHGALLENLNQINGDVIFIKNIDNVVPDRLKTLTIIYKKILGGYLIILQKEIFRYLHLLSEEEINEERIREMTDFCKEKLNITFPVGFDILSVSERCAFIYERLNRPLRVCGIVRNEGEPGGGPFWVDEGDGIQSLQIVEEFQVDKNSSAQQAIWSSATHFNPVDLVCGVRDYRMRNFDLHQFANRKAVGISQKSEKGREIRALELPGLWNGSMYFWNTVFVEVPPETFNPVKNVDDLLRDEHQP